jgi:hypothetical protein
MSSEKLNSRRNFLKTSAAGVAGALAGSALFPSIAAAAGTRNAWVDGMQINPNIDNLRMVLCKDPTQPYWNVQPDVCWANMDQVVMRLAQKLTPAEAWATIFRKPASKQWADVKVGLKVAVIHPHFVTKVIDVLHGYGVPYKNFYTWQSDAESNTLWVGPDVAAVPEVNSVTGLQMGGYKRTSADVLLPTGVKTMPFDAPAYMVDGFDIIVNLATDRWHPADIGRATLCVKNHFGSTNNTGNLTRAGFLHAEPQANVALDLNKHDMILGGNPVRQQLCMIASQGALNGADWLAMGTFAPALDYVFIKKFRIPQGEDTIANVNQATIDKFATFYGYTPAQFDAIDFVDWKAPILATSASPVRAHAQERIELSMSNSAFKPASVHFDIPPEEIMHMSTSIFDQHGRLVREMRNSGYSAITWDGLSSFGTRVPSGTYVIRMSGGRTQAAASLTLVAR